ncbi:bifunctional metallophosphatase/5'-nucleotidase [bacterium]|nr:bifunctional metallophosphatase/5'-nucleotidase [bacterium]
MLGFTRLNRIYLATIFLFFIVTVFGVERNITFAFTTNFRSQLTPIDSDSGSLGGSVRASRLIRDLRLRSDRFILLDGGNHFGGFQYSFGGGIPEVELMNLDRYDAMLLGAEELAMGEDYLDKWAHLARFPIVLSNLIAPPQCKICRHVVSYTTTERGGLIVGIFGILSPETPARPYGVVELEEDIIAVVRQTVDILDEKCDVIVLLSQLGPEDNISIASSICEIDLIISGEWHSYEDEPIVIRNERGCCTIIGCACERGAMLGILGSTWSESDELIDYRWSSQYLDEKISPDQNAFDIVESFTKSLPQPETLFVITSELDARDAILATGESNFGNLLTDALLHNHPEADVALVPAGSIFGDQIIPIGPVTDIDILDLLPYNEQTAILTIDGLTLSLILNKSVNFIGLIHGGFLQVGGVSIQIDTSHYSDGEPFSISEIFIMGKKLNPKAEYIIATTDFVADGGFGYSELEDITYKTGQPIAELLIDYLKDNVVIPRFEDRIRIAP